MCHCVVLASLRAYLQRVHHRLDRHEVRILM
jgi:hypothetical protein